MGCKFELELKSSLLKRCSCETLEQQEYFGIVIVEFSPGLYTSTANFKAISNIQYIV
jgi:hypothetical protein